MRALGGIVAASSLGVLPIEAWSVALGAASFGCSRREAPAPSASATGPSARPASAASSAGRDSVVSMPTIPADRDPPEAQAARERLVRGIVADGPPWPGAVWEPRVLDAMRRVPRHLFVDGVGTATAYTDRPLPIGHRQTISQPRVVAIMTQALALAGSERVLEIGTGSGYQSAVLATVARRVHSIEIVEPLGRLAAKRLAELGFANVDVRIGDGWAGWPEHAPFDRVLLTAAPPTMPPALVDQLADGGVIVAPVGDQDDIQRLVRWTKRGADLVKEDLGAVRFVPMVRPGD